MFSTVDEKLQLLALDHDEFSQGLANLTKFYLDGKKDDNTEDPCKTNNSSNILNNYLALEDNTPIVNP